MYHSNQKSKAEFRACQGKLEIIQKDTAIVFWFYQLLVEKLFCLGHYLETEIPKYWANRKSKDRRLRREIQRKHKCKDQVLAFICSLILTRLQEVIYIAFLRSYFVFQGTSCNICMGHCCQNQRNSEELRLVLERHPLENSARDFRCEY